MTAAPRTPAAALSGGPRAAILVLIAGALMLAVACDALNPPAATPRSYPLVSLSLPPTPSPTPDPAREAIKAFVARVTKKGFSYQATFSGKDRHSTDILPISDGLLQVSGNDVRVRATFKFPRGLGQATVEHRYVGGKAWAKVSGETKWLRFPLPKEDTMEAFAAVKDVTDVTFVEAVKSGGKPLYRVSFRSAILNPILIPAGNLSDTELTTPKLTLLITPDGLPTKGEAEIDGKGRVSGQLQEIVIELSVTFTKVGQAVTIKAP